MKNILIVSHTDYIIEKQKTILNRSDVQIFAATTSEKALEIHRQHHMDIIIIDLHMPVVPGDKLCSMIRKDPTLQKVSIILVCDNNKTEIERCLNCTANAYITRPVKSALFLDQVSKFLRVPTRKSCRVLLKITVEGTHRNESFFCYSKDISTSGMLLETAKSLKIHDAIACSFFLPDSTQITTSGKIVRAVKNQGSPYQYGIVFPNLSAEASSAIEGFIKKRA